MHVKDSYSAGLSVGTNEVELCESRSVRRAWVRISNTHASNLVYVSLGDSAAAAGTGILVPPARSVVIDEWNGAVHAVASATTTVAFTEAFLDRLPPDVVESSSSSSSSFSSSSSSSSSLSSSSSSSSSLSSSSSSSSSP